MFWNLLSASTPDSSSAGGSNWSTIIIWVIVIGAFVVLTITSRRSQKKREAEVQKRLDSVQPGSKVKTIGGICGVVVEVNAEEKTFVLETGTENNKSYLKFDRQAIYQTDAEPTAEETKEVETSENVEEKAEEKKENE